MLLISLLIFLSHPAARAAKVAPSCVQSDWAGTALGALSASGAQGLDVASGIRNFCEEFSRTDGEKVLYRQTLLLKTVISSYRAYLSFPLPATSSYSAQKLGAPMEVQLKSRLQTISANPRALERIRMTYKLVAEAQGTFDFAVWLPAPPDGKAWPILSYLSDKGAKHSGFNGVNSAGRRVSALLYWALWQVRKGPAGKPEFEPTLAVGWLPNQDGSTDGAAWVRVTMMSEKKSGPVFDLDPLQFKEFTPLWPRLVATDLVQRERLVRLCRDAKNCEVSRTLRSIPES